MTRTFDPFDELAAMFLTVPPGSEILPAPPAPVSMPSPSALPLQSAAAPQCAPPRRAINTPSTATELLIVGHLPVRAGLWLTPYADALARDLGSIALLRLDGDEPAVQLLRAPLDASSAELGALQQAIGEIAATIDMWVIRPTIASKPADLVQAGAGRITILTGADEAAIVAAYQLIKDLAQAAEQAQCALPAIGMAIVGIDHANAVAVIERLNRTTISFLGVEVRLVLAMPRMDAGVKSTRYVSFSGQAPPALGEVMNWIDQARTKSAILDEQPAVAGQLYKDRSELEVLDAERILRMPAPAAPRMSQASAPALPIAPRSAPLPPYQPPPAPAPEPEFMPQPPMAPSAAASAAPIRPVKLPPKPSFIMEPKQPARAIEPDEQGKPVPLAKYVNGLTPLPIRSPGHERVEIAIDAAGRMHLLTREHAMRELRIVENWAFAHREIIAMACPQHAINHAGNAVCHIFSNEPASLADLHGTDYCLHVLAPVEVNGQTGWYAAPLNAAAR